MRRPRDPKAEAAAWFQRLAHKITLADLRAFWAWRDTAAHDAVGRQTEREGLRPRSRYRVVPDAHGFSVIDSWTQEVACFANAVQAGISEQDADDVCELLNRRAADQGERRRRN